jgi:hypothetical protein
MVPPVIGSRTTLAFAAFGIIVSAAACSDEKHSRAEIVAGIRADPQLAGADDRTVNCLADWYEKYATDEQRSALHIDGVDLAADAAPVGTAAGSAMLDCVKLATEIR